MEKSKIKIEKDFVMDTIILFLDDYKAANDEKKDLLRGMIYELINKYMDYEIKRKITNSISFIVERDDIEEKLKIPQLQEISDIMDKLVQMNSEKE